MKLTVVIPVYNEEKTIERVIEKVRRSSVLLEKEIIVVDDGSKDRTKEIVKKIPDVVLIEHEKNIGKGRAVASGFEKATGDIVLIQDADLEYDPGDYEKLLWPIIEDKADVVFGTRFRGEYQRVLYFWHYLGNAFLTILSNLFTNLNLSDMETGYKVFRKNVVDSIKHRLTSRRFGIEPELVARVAHGRWRVYEVPISYFGRTYQEGKKIRWWHGIHAVIAIVYFNVFDR